MSRSRFGVSLLAALVVVGLVPVTASAELAESRIGNRVWDDLDGNGRQGPGEPGVAGVTVELLDGTDMVVDSTVTGLKGKWGFVVDPGVAWKVRVTAPGGRAFTTQDAAADAKDSDAGGGGVIDIPLGSLSAGVTDLSFDAGVVPTVLGTRIGDRVWEDADGNGRQNPGEPGLPGVTVELLGAHESLVATTTTTNGRGRWWFIVDTAGAYWVRVTAPDGRAFTTRDVGGDNRDSDADDTGLITIGALSPGGIDISLDAGLLLAPGTIEIVKDASPDGPQDFTFTDDIAAPNVFTLDDDGADATHSNTKTFQAVAPGLYRVNEAAVDGWVVTSVTCLDSDGLGMPSTGDTLKRSAVIELDPGETVTCTFTNTANQAPLFDGNEGGVTLLIDAAENQTAVTDLEATDADGDTENGGGLTYSLTVGGEGDDNDLFTLDVDTGVLTFTTAPDFENPTDDLADNLYLAQVQVTDSGGLFDIQDITVTVTDVGEALEITSDGGGATAAVSAAENQTAVTDVQAFDPEGDTENGGGLTYALTGGAAECDLLRCDLRIVPTVGADNGRFTLDPATGVLTFTAAPDFENPLDLDGDNDYQVQVTVTDSDLNTDVQDITVTVTDVDDAPLNGTITVTLTASVPGPDVITFSEDITAEAAFMLDDNPASGMPNTITFENVTPGTYSVSRAPFSLMLLGNGCTDTDAGGVASVMDLATGVATINLEAGETVACTFLGIFE